MYIKRVDIRGFKTFGKKSTVHFGRGLTIITGPNGSGKSNILDSVKFALGELSPKELRGETIGDLIHKGAVATSSYSAWVAVQFDNSDRRIPVDAEAVTISREFRRGGEGIYRMNGRKVSRKQLTDILSSADIMATTYNIVPQHAITRLAEVTPEERRKIIEDMIGIGVYDNKKASAQVELQKSDVNLQVASAKIEEVRLRVEALEKERNDFLRYSQIRNEINELQAKTLSYTISKEEVKAGELDREVTEHQQQTQGLKAKRDELIQAKSKLEGEKREYEDSVADKGSNRLVQLQSEIGDANASIARVKGHIDAVEGTIESLKKQKIELEENSREIVKKVTAAKENLEPLKSGQANIKNSIESGQAEVDESAKSLSGLRETLGQYNKEAEDLETTIGGLTNRSIKFDAQTKASATKIDILGNHKKTMSSRKLEYEGILQNLAKQIDGLEAARKDEERRASEAGEKIAEYGKLREQMVNETENANEVAKRSGLALTEIETQKSTTENLTADDQALSLIEEMSREGTVFGVYGRLMDIVRIKNGRGEAVEAAAAGWMKALVVKNIEAAVSCVEVLKKTKIGRIKIIPVEGLGEPRKPKVPEGIEGIIGPIIEELEYPEHLKAAVSYVFGDTLLASNQKSSFLASIRGSRTVAITGDLYEPGGAMETGFFRQPLDISRLLLNNKTLGQLKTTLSSLERMAGKAKEEILRIDNEISERNRDKIKSQGLIRSLEREISSFQENIQRSSTIVQESATRLELLTREIGTEQATLDASAWKKTRILAELAGYQRKLDSLKIGGQSAALLEKENQHSEATKRLNELIRQKIETESRIESLTSTISAIEPSVEQTRTQQTSIDNQIEKLTSELSSSGAELSKYQEGLGQLEIAKTELAKELSGLKVKRDEYDSQLQGMDKEITEILEQFDEVNNENAELSASLKNARMQIDFHFNELKEIGYTQLLEASPEEMEGVQHILPILKKELTAIGGVNELAASQYEEVKENYKHLATRIYELEKEKMSIVQFMNELDQRKLEAFMKAFNQVSESFNQIFSTVTSGVGRLFLENSEKPFEAGADIRLQFPGKTDMTIGSASGGEKSVGTVCFILALQAIHPMPFYMMDEIDAHLDVVNSQRLADLLKSKSKGSQFIIVSLKDVTIARGDSVYGVFIQEGVSQVVGLPMQEVRAVGRTK